ncbi:MAG: patatin-like protein [Trueperaceae bacterium]|nr:patatin-like protein [Trueperaceae bacterium]
MQATGADRDVHREIRLAVVMYGGTSLAIYMNGISQELLQLVRATSPAADPEAATTNTARVYRRLAHVLGGTPLDQIDDDVLVSPPPVRFIVDILSGTSAGGINAVMLGKALARNADLEPLKRLWLQQGALEKLINDHRSSSPTRYPYREPVKALFQSDRMYVELLNAMDALNRSSPEGTGALVKDLDLVVTGTDLAGQVAQLRLADGVVHEYDHKHAFTFRLAERGLEHDEFTAEHDPLLAFAARTTSSLPAAFEPAVVRGAQRLAGRRHAGAPWAKLFRSGREDTPDRQVRRAFADGGYLDNKPFGHAIDRLSEAPSGVRVQRKLYYLEPAPERIDPEAPVALDDVPNALENTMKVVTLARYETIRADIQRIVERNRLLDRIRTLGFGVLEDVPIPDDPNDATAGPIDPKRAPLQGLVAQYGYAYGAYHRLRVARTTDALADTIADALRVPPDDDVRRALRRVASAWRNSHFQRNTSEERPDAELEWDFLQRFDLATYARRARYLLNRIDQAFVFDRDLVNELRHVVGTNTHLDALVRAYDRGDTRSVDDAWSEVQPLLRLAKTSAQRAVFALDPGRGAGEATDIHVALRDLVHSGGGSGGFASFREALIAILAAPTDAAGWQAAEAFLARHRPLIDAVAATIAQHNRERTVKSGEALRDLTELEVSPALASEVRTLLLRYWKHFRHFDMVQYPLLEATDVGHEFAPVDVHRISPVDAGHYGQAIPDDKLYGARFASFGAFLDEGWRAHDIRWGRLDGAERLIATMLDGAPIEARDEVREHLVTEAHLAIVEDEFHLGEEGRKALRVERRTEDGGAELDVGATKAKVARFLTERREGLQLDPRRTTDSLSRLVRVSGKLTDTLSTESRMPDAVRNLVGFVSFAGANLLVAAIPKTFANLLASYWANLLLLFGAVLLLIDNPLWTLASLGHGPVLGAGLVLFALAFLMFRALLWSALSPREARRRGRVVPGRDGSVWFCRSSASCWRLRSGTSRRWGRAARASQTCSAIPPSPSPWGSRARPARWPASSGRTPARPA